MKGYSLKNIILETSVLVCMTKITLSCVSGMFNGSHAVSQKRVTCEHTVRDGQSGVQETNTMFTVAHVFYSRRPKDNPVVRRRSR